ncbi:MAG: lasso peptide biosynthesis B2 protein [Halioglobus sp.]
MHRLRKLWQLPRRQKALLVRSWYLTGCYQLALARRPLARLTADMNHSESAQKVVEVSHEALFQAHTMGYLVAAASRVTPWRSRCLVQVLVVQHLMAEQQIPGQILIGVSPSAGGSENEDAFGAHAWLRCGDSIVSGESGSDQYRVISSYTWQ